MLDVYEAVTSRRAVRAFSDRPVPREALDRVLSAATRTPSASNLQPWHVYVLTDGALAELKKRTCRRLTAGDAWDEPEYQQYPPVLKSPYRERRSAFGEQRYGALGIAREDLEARQRAAAANWECFGAPAALFCYVDRDMGPAQWSDVGMYLQTVMLLLRAEGLHSCPQMAWAKFHTTVAEILSPPDQLILFCGMSIGFEDDTARCFRTGRAPLAETVAFVDTVDAAQPVPLPEGTAATGSTSRLHGAGTTPTAPAKRHAPRSGPLRRVAARLSDGFARRVGRLASQVGLPPGGG
ncbi:hypothetical protein GCM10010254_62900 [Streptomyces chromofuscus]|nr:hypothetical protein GCM10010254_62900 [Streptomyces chromofuscus]